MHTFKIASRFAAPTQTELKIRRTALTARCHTLAKQQRAEPSPLRAKILAELERLRAEIHSLID